MLLFDKKAYTKLYCLIIPKKIIIGLRMRSLSFISLLMITLFFQAGVLRADRLLLPAIEQQSLTDLLLLSITKVDQRLVAVGEQGVIIYSDDNGETWHQAKVPVSTLFTRVHFFDNQQGWAVGHDGVVVHSSDRGESWSKKLEGSQLNSLRVKALAAEFERLSLNSEQYADQLEEIEYQLDDARGAADEAPSAPLLDIYFTDQKTGYLLGSYGMFFKTDDGGRSWHYRGHHLPNPEGFHLNKLYQTGDGQLLILGEAGLLLESVDGTAWQAVESPYEGSFFTAVETDGLYLMGLRGNVFKRKGMGWEPIVLPHRSTITGAAAIEGKAYLVGQGGALLKQQGDRFIPHSDRGLLSYADLVVAGNRLVIVGENGVSRVALSGGEQ